jgi:hypothetical protein
MNGKDGLGEPPEAVMDGCAQGFRQWVDHFSLHVFI